jgi:hypothetical protein
VKTRCAILKEELESLEKFNERREDLASKKKNERGQEVLSYEEGFTWCPKCHYVSNISLQ